MDNNQQNQQPDRQPPSPAADNYAQRGSQPTNGMAIAGFILAFLVPILGLIFSIIGSKKSKELDGQGKGLAVAGIVISALGILLGILMFMAILSAEPVVDQGSPLDVGPGTSEVIIIDDGLGQ